MGHINSLAPPKHTQHMTLDSHREQARLGTCTRRWPAAESMTKRSATCWSRTGRRTGRWCSRWTRAPGPAATPHKTCWPTRILFHRLHGSGGSTQSTWSRKTGCTPALHLLLYWYTLLARTSLLPQVCPTMTAVNHGNAPGQVAHPPTQTSAPNNNPQATGRLCKRTSLSRTSCVLACPLIRFFFLSHSGQPLHVETTQDVQQGQRIHSSLLPCGVLCVIAHAVARE